jgi:hypothetical protein
MNDKVNRMNDYMEQKRKEEEENRDPMMNELDRLDNDKADKIEFIQLKNKVEELKEAVDAFDEDDEYDDEDDSVEEDVLSLAKSGGEQSEDSEEQQDNGMVVDTKPLKKLEASKAEKNPTMPLITLDNAIFRQSEPIINSKFKPNVDSLGLKDDPNIQKVLISITDNQEEIKLDDDNDSPLIKPIRIDATPKEETHSRLKLIDQNNDAPNDNKLEAIRLTSGNANNTVDDRNKTLTSGINPPIAHISGSGARPKNVMRKDTVSSKASNFGLSRINSKMSLVSSRKKGPGAGMKLKIDELKTQSIEIKMNTDKNLEDVRVLKATENNRKQRFEYMEEIINKLQENFDQWHVDHDGKVT